MRAHRIVGRFVGTIVASQQNNEDKKITTYLPFKLTRCEVGLLVEELVFNSRDSGGGIELLRACQLVEKDLSEFKEKLQSYKDELVELKNSEYITSRKNQLVSMRDQILTAKRKKLNDQLNKTKTDEDEKRSKVLHI